MITCSFESFTPGLQLAELQAWEAVESSIERRTEKTLNIKRAQLLRGQKPFRSLEGKVCKVKAVAVDVLLIALREDVAA